MNREEIVEELNRYVKSINQEFMVDDSNGDLTLWARHNDVAWFKEYHRDNFVLDASIDNDLTKDVIETDILKKFYIKGIELLDKMKYTIQVFRQNQKFYLNYVPTGNLYLFADYKQTPVFKTQFTKNEIKKIKEDSDLHIDWNKAIIEEVDD